MKDFRIIVTDNRQDYELKIRKNLDEGYKMINSNLTVTYPTFQRINNITASKELYFYAYMEKEA